MISAMTKIRKGRDHLDMMPTTCLPTAKQDSNSKKEKAKRNKDMDERGKTRKTHATGCMLPYIGENTEIFFF